MRIAGKGCVLDAGGDQKSPPLPFIEVDEDTARALIGTGVAVAFEGDDGLAAEWAESERKAAEEAQAELAANAAAEVEAKRLTDEEAEEAARIAAAEADSKAAEEAERLAAEQGGEGREGGEGGNDADAERKQTIADALELLEPEHLVKTGPRAGRPKVKAVEEISGINDLTPEEIDAVAAAKDAE